MVIISIIGGVGETSVSVFGGPIAIPLLILSFFIVTAIPMLYFISRDIKALRNKGVNWNRKSRWFYYLIAIPLPAWLMTIIYAVRRKGKIEST